MNWVVMICGLLYNVVIIAIVTIWLKSRAVRTNVSDDFILSGRNLPWYVVGATVALTGIGGGHINGLTAQAWGTGYTTIWYCVAHGFAFTLMLRLIAPWFRRMGFTTIPDCFKKMFGSGFGVLVTGMFCGYLAGCITMETQGLGVIIESTTGLSILLATIVGVVIGILYVIFAGMKEIGWVNLINAILMYVFGFALLVYIGTWFPGGWKGINEALVSSGHEQLFHSLGSWDTVRTYIVGTILSCTFGMSFSQQGIQPAFSCKNIKVLKKAVYAAVPLNVCFGVIVLSLGLASLASPEAAATGGGNTGAMWLVLNVCPPWLTICTIGLFLAACLSTFAMVALGASTIIVCDVQTPYFTKDRYMSPKKQANWCRFWIIVVSVIAVIVAGWGGTSINAIVIWMMAFAIPLFFIWLLGMFWKRSHIGALITMLLCWAADCVLTLTGLAAAIKLEGNNYAIFMMVLSIIIYLIVTSLDKKARPAYKKIYQQQHAAYIASMDLNAKKARGGAVPLADV